MAKDQKNQTNEILQADPQNSSRRKAVKTIAGGVGALAAYHVLPVNWSKPIIEQVFLPVHAAVSGITLSDPCTAELVSGDQETSIDVIRVSGFVTPPVAGLQVTVVATPNGGSGGPVTVTTSTGSDGTYSAEITMVGGPGIVGVGATTTVTGVNGVAHCPVGIPPADHPSAQRPQTNHYSGTITLDETSSSGTSNISRQICVSITGDNVVFYYTSGGSTSTGTGTVSGGVSFMAGFWDYLVAFSNLSQTSVTIDMNGTFGNGTRTGSAVLNSTPTPCS
jgi:hypothetical protein